MDPDPNFEERIEAEHRAAEQRAATHAAMLKASKELSDEAVDGGSLIQRLRGRSDYLRNMGEVKSPDLMTQAADALDNLA